MGSQVVLHIGMQHTATDTATDCNRLQHALQQALLEQPSGAPCGYATDSSTHLNRLQKTTMQQTATDLA